jgi:hypothetical protein
MEREEMKSFKFKDSWDDTQRVRFHKDGRTTVVTVVEDSIMRHVYVDVVNRYYKDPEDDYTAAKIVFEKVLNNFDKESRKNAWKAFFAANPRPVEKAA